jgi:seryl-tRNA synthetase
MNPYTEIERITEELRALHENTNEGPKLIADMVERELPKSYALLTESLGIDDLKEELETVEGRLRETNSELADALARIDELEADSKNDD